MTRLPEQIRILCVDDERNVLRALERFFLDDNYEIVNAGSGSEGLHALEESGPFQVVISDYRMPLMNGVEFLKAVYCRWPETVRLVLSGYADVGAIVAAINEGHIYKFIPKPWNDDDLRVTIQNSLDLYLLQKKNRELREELSIANQAREASQDLLSSLPAGVVGVDADGLIFYCNSRAGMLLNNGRTEIAGTHISAYGDTLCRLVEHPQHEKGTLVETATAGRPCRVMGSTVDTGGKNNVILLFLEV